MIERKFYRILDRLGYTVEYDDLSHLDRLGDCCTRRKRIRLDHTITQREIPFVLGHETRHAIKGDVPTMFGHFDARTERQADEWSASQCIPLDDFRDAEAQFSGHVPTMAFHLGVPDEAVVVLQGMLSRLGSVVYFDSKMGAGQWGARIEVA